MKPMTKSYTDCADVYFDEDLYAVALVYKQRLEGYNMFVEVHQDILDVFLQHTSNAFFVDTRKMGVLSLDCQRWVVEHLFPGMLKHLKGKTLYHAQVISKQDAFAKFGADNIRSQSEKKIEGIEIKAFEEEEEAKAWIKSYSLNSFK